MRTLILLCALAFAASAHAQHAELDTLDLYGGPGTLEGKFQTATGEPDSQGWIGVDETAVQQENAWNISTYRAANLDTTVAGNHAWWCGEDIPSCGGIDPDGGYGNDWDTALGYGRQVDPTREATVTLRGVMNLYVEPGYDYLRIEALTASGPVIVHTQDGIGEGYILNLARVWQPDEFTGDAGDEVRYRLRVTSDAGWSDEDCSFPTSGAVQVDNLQLVIEQPGLPTDVGPVETCEPGDPVGWEPVTAYVGAGNFAQLWSGLDDLDPDVDNHSPQWAFVDDGIVVPGVGPTRCWTKCYGPDSLVVNHDYRGSPAFGNSILSPPIALAEGWVGTLHLAFDAYIDPAICFNVFVTWGMQATDDPAGLTGWNESWHDFLLYSAGTYSRREFIVRPEMVPPSSRHVRIKLQARQAGSMCWGPMDSPAPYLDNVRLQLGPLVVSDALPPAAGLEATAAPNPFNPATVVRWNLPRAEDLAIRIHDARGRLIRTLHTGQAAAGTGEVTWRGRNDGGQSVAAGVYFCRLESASGARTLKVTLLK